MNSQGCQFAKQARWASLAIVPWSCCLSTVVSAHAELPPITQPCIRPEGIETNRWKWTEGALAAAYTQSIQDGPIAFLNRGLGPIWVLISAPVMVPVTVLSASADLLAMPFRDLTKTGNLRIEGSIIDAEGRVAPGSRCQLTVLSYRRRCTEAVPCQPTDVKKYADPLYSDSAGAVSTIVQGDLTFNDYFDVRFDPPSNYVLRVAMDKGKELRVTSTGPSLAKCPLRISVASRIRQVPIVPEPPAGPTPKAALELATNLGSQHHLDSCQQEYIHGLIVENNLTEATLVVEETAKEIELTSAHKCKGGESKQSTPAK